MATLKASTVTGDLSVSGNLAAANAPSAPTQVVRKVDVLDSNGKLLPSLAPAKVWIPVKNTSPQQWMQLVISMDGGTPSPEIDPSTATTTPS